MVRNPEMSCSPYLLAERRELSDACRQIAKAQGQAAPPCDACPLVDICKPPPSANQAPARRPQSAAPIGAQSPRTSAAEARPAGLA